MVVLVCSSKEQPLVFGVQRCCAASVSVRVTPKVALQKNTSHMGKIGGSERNHLLRAHRGAISDDAPRGASSYAQEAHNGVRFFEFLSLTQSSWER